MKNKLYRILRRSEKYTKTDMAYLASGGFWLTFGQVISAAATFGLAIAFANLLPKETYGTYKFVLSIAGVLSVFALPGMMTSLTQAVARGFEGSTTPALRARLQWGTLGGLASLGVAGYYFVSGNLTLAVSFLIVAAFLPLMDAFGIYEGLLTGKKRFRELSTYSLAQKLVSVALMVGTMFATTNLSLILLSYFMPYAVLRYLFFRHTVKKYQQNASVDPEAVAYGKHLSLMSVVGPIANNLDKILLFHFLGAAPLAVYTIAIAPPEQLKGILKNINILALPKFSERSLGEIYAGMKNKVWKFGLLLIAVSLIYILIAPAIFRIFFPQYLESIPYSQVFSLSIVAVLLFLPLSVLQAHKRTKELYKFNIATAAFQTILYLVLVPLYGLWGAIAAWMIGRIFNLGYSFFLMYRLRSQSTTH